MQKQNETRKEEEEQADERQIVEEDEQALIQVLNVSAKVKRLIQILNEESSQSKKMPKVIVFVKDRVVAEYLNKILNTSIESHK